MIYSYIKIAVRNLWRNKGFSILNITGLAIGIATCLIIILYVRHELSYDQFNEKADRMVRVIFQGQVKGEKMKEASVFPPVAQTLLKEYPEVEEATRLSHGGAPLVTYNNKSFQEDELAFADANFFNVFTLPFIMGDPNSALTAPNTMVISRSLATKYFGDSDPLGKIIKLKSRNADYTITGVFDKVPENAHFHFDMFASMASLPDASSTSWMSSGYYTYLVLQEGYDYRNLERKLPVTVEKYMAPQMLQTMGMSFDQFRSGGNDVGIYLQPLTDIHLHSDLTNDLKSPGNIQYVYIFSAIAVFMLLIACINFMNLSTASAARRGREVGIRKVMGSVKSQLITQFLLESLLLTALALVLAVILAQISLPMFNTLAGRDLHLNLTMDPWMLPGLLILGLITGIVAGGYPAFFLSSFKPVSVLKGRVLSAGKSIGLRSALVVFQFFISITLMVSVAVVYNQLSYIQHKELGYNKDQVLILPDAWMLGEKQQVLRDILEKDPRTVSITSSAYLPAGPSYGNNFFIYEQDPAEQIKTLRYEVDGQYIQTLGMEMAHGRNFSRALSTDSFAMILNETAVRALGWTDNAIGKSLTHTNNGVTTTYRVIGVVKDFHFKSMHEPISPLAMTLNAGYGSLIIKAKSQDMAGFLSAIKDQWRQLNAEAPFNFSFLDERFNNTYKSDQRTGIILGIFATLTIFVACLGLFGLAAFTARQRNKEISIRKVLGASVGGIVTLLSGEFLKLVAIAFIIAAPFAWLIMNKWLQNFAYRVSIDWSIFALAALAAVFITMVTISFQAVKAALVNPVDSLHSE